MKLLKIGTPTTTTFGPVDLSMWTAIGGGLLVVSGGIALAFGSAVIAGIGLGVIAIGVAYLLVA